MRGMRGIVVNQKAHLPSEVGYLESYVGHLPPRKTRGVLKTSPSSPPFPLSPPNPLEAAFLPVCFVQHLMNYDRLHLNQLATMHANGNKNKES
jgi:hypothetical protein